MYLKREAFPLKSLEMRWEENHNFVLTTKDLYQVSKGNRNSPVWQDSHICKEVFTYFCCKVLFNNYIDMTVVKKKTKNQ